MDWHNEPADWRETADGLVVDVPGGTDCWRHTRHDFVQHDAPFYHRPVAGDFVATVTVDGEYDATYDQAGLLVQDTESRWLKCGVEYVDGAAHASAVVTREYSDWSVVPLSGEPGPVRVRVERIGPTVEVAYARPDESFTMIRQATLTDAESVLVGPMAAAPQGEGFCARFADFEVESPVRE